MATAQLLSILGIFGAVILFIILIYMQGKKVANAHHESEAARRIIEEARLRSEYVDETLKIDERAANEIAASKTDTDDELAARIKRLLSDGIRQDS